MDSRTAVYVLMIVLIWDCKDSRTEAVNIRPAAMRHGKNDESLNKNSSFRRWLSSTLSNYDSRLRPYFSTKVMKIQLRFWMIGISQISEKDMSFTVEMFFHEQWTDPRLRFNVSQLNGHNPLTLPANAPELFWLPDTSFLNALRSTAPKQRGSISHMHYMKLKNDGTVTRSRRISVTADCPMDLTMYPFDQQACWLKLSSYGWTVDDVIYEWSLADDSIPIDSISLQDYHIARYLSRVSNKTFHRGTFSMPQICIELHRRTGYYYLQLIIPATAVLGSGWIALWLESQAKFGDLVAVILAIIFLSYSYNNMMPKVNYVKAMDVYLAACFLFSFLSLAKLAIMKKMKQRVAKYKERRKLSNVAKAQVVELMDLPSSESLHQDGSNENVFAEELAKAKNATGKDSKSKQTRSSSKEDTTPRRKSAYAIQKNAGKTVGRKHRTMSLILKSARMNINDHHDAYWRLMMWFHISTQLVFPLLFAAFGLFYFFVYPYLGARSECV